MNVFTRLALCLAAGSLLLAGCGKDGKDGLPGAAGKDATGIVKVSDLTTDQWSALAPKGEVLSVSINSPPVVKFKVTDANGNPVVGLGNTTKSATATVASYPNVAFSLAKLVPGKDGSPSKWVSYIVTTVPSTTAAATATRPTTDNTGTLVDHGDGTYTYTFYRDITKIKDQVAALTDSGNNKKADLGDLTYDPNLTHRLYIQISGAARGTGTNTADASNSGVASASIVDPANIIYDFVPATGKAVTSANAQRNVVSTESCNECHSKLNGLGFHGGSRNDVRACTVCHTDQRKYGQAASTSSNNAFTGRTYIADGEVQGNLPVFIHKLHAGEALKKTGYDYAGVAYNHITYPQPITNCVKCHSKADQAANWSNVPSRLACGTCHDGVNFATGTGHVGGSASNDQNCILCHKSADITRYHVTVDPTGANGRAGYPLNTAVNVPTNGYPKDQGPSIPLASQLNLPSGVYKIAYEIKSVKVVGAAGAKKAQITYRILKDGQPVTLRSSGFLIDNVDGSPGLYIAYAAANTTIGVAAPADWTNYFNVSVKNVRDGVSGNSQTGPDAEGYYTATLATIIPDTATMVTGVVGIDYSGFVQLNHPAYPQGIRLNDSVFPVKVADGYTARRAIVSAAKCNACHGQLGTGPSFHGGTRNNGEGCAVCHYNGRATGHVGASYSYGGGWSISAKDMIHGIHASGKREKDYSYEATASNPAGFGHVTYPGVLKNCEQCHVAGSYDFTNTASKNALNGLLWSAALSGNFPDPGANTVIGLSPWVKYFGNGYEDYSAGAGANHLVISPITASCFGCHDSSSAVAHMQQNGGKLYVKRSTTLVNGVAVNTESCMACHGSGKIGDIKKVHSK